MIRSQATGLIWTVFIVVSPRSVKCTCLYCRYYAYVVVSLSRPVLWLSATTSSPSDLSKV